MEFKFNHELFKEIKVKVCIVRNAEAESNANMMRVLDALIYGGFEVLLLSRNRKNNDKDEVVLKKELIVKGISIDNYEIQLPSSRGNGVKNITILLRYITIVFLWMIKNNEKYDYIHAFDLDTGFPSLLATVFHNKFLIYHIADFYVDSRSGIPKLFQNTVKKMEFKVINNAHLTIICTEERRKQIKGSFPNKLAVIHNTPVDFYNKNQIKYKKASTQYKKLKISYVGGLSKTRFIEEILEVVSSDKRLSIDIAGYGVLSNVVKKYDENFDNINFKGQIDYTKSLELNANCDLMVAMYDPQYKNHKFSAPNKVYEAMSFSKPIIVAEGTGIDKLVYKEKMGVVSKYNINSFKEKIDKLLNNPKLFNEYGKNAEKAYIDYSWKKMRSKLIYEYNNLKTE